MRKPALCLVLAMLCCACFPAASETKTYTNPETGYRAVLEDDIDLLTEEQEADILKSMKALTDYTNAAFWSSRSAGSQSQAVNNAEKKHISLFGSGVNGIVFIIDMNARYMFLDTEGWIQTVIPKSTAQIITNNVRTDMSAGRYYKASNEVFRQVQTKINGEKIAEPMRYLSAAAIGLMGGLLFALFLTVSMRKIMRVPVYTTAAAAAAVVSTYTYQLNKLKYTSTSTKEIYSPQTSSDSSCSSCSGGSSCGGGSSCSSGSSCGGGSSF